MSFQPKCRECGNERDFREYEWVSYIVIYENGGKESETEEYGELPDEVYPTQCLVCESTDVEFEWR